MIIEEICEGEQGSQDLDGEREDPAVDREAGTDGRVSRQFPGRTIMKEGIGLEVPVSFVPKRDIGLRTVSRERSDLAECVVNGNKGFIGYSLNKTIATVKEKSGRIFIGVKFFTDKSDECLEDRREDCVMDDEFSKSLWEVRINQSEQKK